MWPNLFSEVATRMHAARVLLTAVNGARGELPSTLPMTHETTVRGLMFVQLYAVYEYTVKTMVQAGVNEIKASGATLNTIRLELLALCLDKLFQSAADSGTDKKWQARIKALVQTVSSDALDVSDDVFPNDGSQFRLSQLRIIWALFGIDENAVPVVPNIRLRERVGELVERRNAVAHGRETPEQVGRRFSRDELHDRIDAVEAICNHLVTAMQSHCSNPVNFRR